MRDSNRHAQSFDAVGTVWLGVLLLPDVLRSSHSNVVHGSVLVLLYKCTPEVRLERKNI